MFHTASPVPAASPARKAAMEPPDQPCNHWLRAVVLALAFVLFAAVILTLSVTIGARSIPFMDALRLLFSGDTASIEGAIIFKRLPRSIFALVIGGCLGVAGLLMQAVTRNPIADPSILGVNSGASLAVVVGISYFGITAAPQYMACAIAGAGVTAVFVYGVGSMGRGGTTPLKLAMAGTAVSMALTSLVSAIMLPDYNVMTQFRFWRVGSVGSGTWDTVIPLIPILLGCVLVAYIMASSLEVLALGEETAVGLGARPGLVSIVASAAAVLLCGAATAFAGPIGFVGLMVPHAVRLLYRGSMRARVLLCLLAGGLLLLLGDVIGRVAGSAFLGSSSAELEVGIVTAVIGAPVFIAIAIRAGSGKALEGGRS